MPRQKNQSNVALRGQGMDSVSNLIQDGHVRSIMVDGEIYASLVDLMSVFGEDNRKSRVRTRDFNPRSYWNDQKRALLAKDRELSDSIGQLPLLSSDGKKYKTDVAPLWACVFIVLLMDTPKATEFKKNLAKFTAVEIKHRMINVARGMEWAADTTHAALIMAGVDMTFSGNDPDLEWHQR